MEPGGDDVCSDSDGGRAGGGVDLSRGGVNPSGKEPIIFHAEFSLSPPELESKRGSLSTMRAIVRRGWRLPALREFSGTCHQRASLRRCSYARLWGLLCLLAIPMVIVLRLSGSRIDDHRSASRDHLLYRCDSY